MNEVARAPPVIARSIAPREILTVLSEFGTMDICLGSIKADMAQPMQQMNTAAPAMAGGVSDKDWTMMLILSILLGGLGVDRFVAGSIGLGILKLLTGGGCGIWWLVDIIMLVTGSYKDGNGLPIMNQ